VTAPHEAPRTDIERVAPSPAAVAAAIAAAHRVASAPDPHSGALRSVIAGRHHIDPDSVLVGPGSASLIHGLIARAAAVGSGHNAVLSHPTFAAYRLLCERHGIEPRTVALRDYRHDLDGIADQVDHRTRLVLVDSPHGITGTVCGFGDVAELSTTLPVGAVTLYDNAYGECDPHTDLDQIAAHACRPGSRVVVSKTFSKAYGLFGARVGYLLGASGLLDSHGPLVQKYDVSSIGQAMAHAAYQDTRWTARNTAVVARARTGIYEVCRRHEVRYVESQSSSVLITPARHANTVARRLRELGCAVVEDTSHDLPGHLQLLATRGDVADHLATALPPHALSQEHHP
jgi:histidinol-phosphate aminotransferase